MRRRPMTAPKPTPKKGTKKVSYELIPFDPENVFAATIHRMKQEIVDEHHDDLKFARIALAWCTSWKPDADGRVILGKCVKASDLHRELSPFDFVVLLNRGFWTDLKVTHEQRRALLDHELCHAGVTYDQRGEPVVDERGRTVYRIIKHDLEEFSQVVERYGIWKRDIERFAAALNRAARGPWVPCSYCQESTHPGYIDPAGDGRLSRCSCWTSWHQAVSA